MKEQLTTKENNKPKKQKMFQDETGKRGTLIHAKDRIVVRADSEQKNQFTFSSGLTIRLERDYNNLDRSYTQQTLTEVISGDGIPPGAMLLVHFNALHPVNEIYNHGQLSGEDIASGIKLYSISENECFLWKMPECSTWNTLKGFCLGLRVYRPYEGLLQGIDPTVIKEVLYATTGEFKGQVVHTVRSADYKIHFRNEKGVDETLIRFRHFPDENHEREEVICLRNDLTELVNSRKLLIGTTINDAKPLPK